MTARDDTSSYKQTRIGVIPTAWKVARLRELVVMMTNGFVGLSKMHYVAHQQGVIYIQGFNVIDGGFNFSGIKYVSYPFHSQHQKSSLRAGDLLTIQTGDVGLTTVVPPNLAGANCHALIITRFKADRVNPSFYMRLFNSDAGRRSLRAVETGTTMKHLNVGDMLEFFVPVPPIAEQSAIVDALDDVSELIGSLERMIAKKQAIKQGMMQQLLTGKTRLPGFTADWVEILLGDHVLYVKTVALSRAELDTYSPLRYLHYGDIHTNSDVRIDAASDEMPRVSASKARNAGRLQVGDLVFADASEDPAGVGKSVEVMSVPIDGLVPGLHTIAARFDKSVLADGFKAYLQFIPGFRDALLRLASGTKVLATTRRYISSVALRLPEVAEQHAIATMLQDVDAEIAALERQLENARNIKQGMMQELLTGRTRLALVEATA